MSKANQKFVQADEAVSPVIGVILMVAITVVLAAVVFVLVSNLGKSGESAPNVTFTKDDGLDRLSVTTAEQGADWNRLSIKVTSCTQADASSAIINIGTDVPPVFINTNAIAGVAAGANDLNDPLATGTVCGAADAKTLSTIANPVDAGDFLDICGSAGASATNVVVQIVDLTANTVVYEGTFANVAACTA